jgi:predicted DNA-binding protein
MFIAPAAEATKQINLRCDFEMDATLGQISSALRTNKSVLVRLAVLKLIEDVRLKKPTSLKELWKDADA